MPTQEQKAIDEKELAFLKELAQHENRWIAFIESNGTETIVGSGNDAVEAMQEAEKRGFADAVLMRVPPFDRGLIPSNFR
jgi:alkanesulfonate monooxygenase SsuD/methylene tetrahydromethanopterin reductase-like flavin-dependent oxidoreductase (luciferase family)